MSVVIESSKPLVELIVKTKRSERKSKIQQMQEALHWATEEFILCVERETDKNGKETVYVRPEKATNPPPSMSALTYMQAWANMSPAKFAETVTRLTMSAGAAANRAPAGKSSPKESTAGDSTMGSLSESAQKKVDSLNRRIEAAKLQRQSTPKAPANDAI